jgi:hypothetical protein
MRYGFWMFDGDPGFREDEVEVTSDGDIVWVNTAGGAIGRFGRNGIDIHTRDTSGCLYCTHAPTGPWDWHIFQQKMWEMHGVMVTDEHRPTRFPPDPS